MSVKTTNVTSGNHHNALCQWICPSVSKLLFSFYVSCEPIQMMKLQCRALLGEEDDEEPEVGHFQSVSQKQREESYTRLKKLLEDGFEMVTNIRVAGDAREIARRLEEEQSRQQR